MPREPEQWTLDGFLDHFQRVHETMRDHRFCWIIGAGASRSAGIPTGAELVDWWLREMYRRECDDGTPIEQWATAARLDIDGFQYEDRAASYPAIYERRFRGFPAEGFAYLEHVMTGNAKSLGESGMEERKPTHVIEPGPGYSILAKIMEKERHRVVITTNFDNLVADALQVFTDTYPLVCGHESLAGFVNVAMQRPVICKIHRDLFFSPINDSRRLRMLHEAWLSTLRSLLAEYTPIVIGYGGNDDSLMDRLNSLEPSEIKGRLVWCYYGDSIPSKRIRELVRELDGVLVPVPDFDRLLILLGTRLGVEVLDQDLEKRQQQRTQRYRDAVTAMKTEDLPQIKGALSRVYRQAWWRWQERVDQKTNPDEKEAEYRKAIKALPNSFQLLSNFAVFLTNLRENHNEAEELFRKAVSFAPDNKQSIVNLALFLSRVRKNYDEAESLFRRAIELEPNNASDLGNFANFLTYVRKNHDEAERLYRRAIDLDSNNADVIGNFANFLANVRNNRDEAERLFRRAVELDSSHANNIGNFAGFLLGHGVLNEATELCDTAIRLNSGASTQLLGELLLYRGTLEALRGETAERTLTELRQLLTTGFTRGIWTFKPLFESVSTRLPLKTLAVLRAYGDAVLSEEKADQLNETLMEIQRTVAANRPSDNGVQNGTVRRATRSRPKSSN